MEKIENFEDIYFLIVEIRKIKWNRKGIVYFEI
jgi:hypothetical protein